MIRQAVGIHDFVKYGPISEYLCNDGSRHWMNRYYGIIAEFRHGKAWVVGPNSSNSLVSLRRITVISEDVAVQLSSRLDGRKEAR